MKNTIYSGPFEYQPLERATINGVRSQLWRMSYGSKMLAEKYLPESMQAGQIIEAFDDCRANFESAAKALSASKMARAWICNLLPDGVRTINPSDWRAPTSWEIRHIVGEGSFTGVSGAYAASLAGVTPQNFRKYTARSDSRQLMSYAMWHLLLHKLGVQILG